MVNEIDPFFSNVIPHSQRAGDGGNLVFMTMAKGKLFPKVILETILSDQYTHMAVTNSDGKLEFEFMWLPESVAKPFYNEIGGKPSVVVQLVSTARSAVFWKTLITISSFGRLSWGKEMEKWINTEQIYVQ